jgi:hypothetical protein
LEVFEGVRIVTNFFRQPLEGSFGDLGGHNSALRFILILLLGIERNLREVSLDALYKYILCSFP